MKPLSDSSRSHMVSSINCNWSWVMLFVLILTEYGLTTVVANIPIKNAPTRNGFVDWYGDRPALDIIIFSVDFVRLYDVSNVPINTANGKNMGTYSNKRIQDSYNASNAVGFDGRRSTNVTANIMPHTTSITRPTPEKNRRNKKRFKIFVLNILCIVYMLIS